MRQQNIVVIGSNSISEKFLISISDFRSKGINILAHSGESQCRATKFACANNIPELSIEDLVRLGEKIDLIIDVSDDAKIRNELRRALFQSNNRHTVIAAPSVISIMRVMLNINDDPNSGIAVGY